MPAVRLRRFAPWLLLSACLAVPKSAEALPLSEWTEINFWGVIDTPGGFFGTSEAGDPFWGVLRYDPYIEDHWDYFRFEVTDGATRWSASTRDLASNVSIDAFGFFATAELAHYVLTVTGKFDGTGQVRMVDGNALLSPFTATITGVPEPSVLLLMALGLGLVFAGSVAAPRYLIATPSISLPTSRVEEPIRSIPVHKPSA